MENININNMSVAELVELQKKLASMNIEQLANQNRLAFLSDMFSKAKFDEKNPWGFSQGDMITAIMDARSFTTDLTPAQQVRELLTRAKDIFQNIPADIRENCKDMFNVLTADGKYKVKVVNASKVKKIQRTEEEKKIMADARKAASKKATEIFHAEMKKQGIIIKAKNKK